MKQDSILVMISLSVAFVTIECIAKNMARERFKMCADLMSAPCMEFCSNKLTPTIICSGKLYKRAFRISDSFRDRCVFFNMNLTHFKAIVWIASHKAMHLLIGFKWHIDNGKVVSPHFTAF